MTCRMEAGRQRKERKDNNLHDVEEDDAPESSELGDSVVGFESGEC